jgi:DNA processing protein
MHAPLMPRHSRSVGRRARYELPDKIDSTSLDTALRNCGRPQLETKQLDMLRRGDTSTGRDITIYYAGNISVLCEACVSIVGTRDVSEQGRKRATRLARELAKAGVTVISGLAKGVDTAAHTSAIAAGGATVAVIGTPLDKAYPAENAELQAQIYRDYLLISPFAIGQDVYKSNFPARNRVMAALSDATAIIEASDTSGTLHQAAECTRLNRWLFIAQSIIDDPDVNWPREFLSYKKAVPLRETADILSRLDLRAGSERCR